MRFKKTGITIALAAVFVMAFAGVATAQETESGKADVWGKGWLAAKGTGNATLDMGGWIKMYIDGDVAVTNLGENFEVRLRVDGTEQYVTESVGPDVLLEDFTGWVGVRGNHFLIELEGELKFKAHGGGVAYLEGTGIYKTRRGPFRVWDTGGVEIAIEEAA